MKAGFSLLRMSLAQSLQYRAAGFSNAVAGVFWGFIFIIIYRVFFLFGENYETPITLEQTVSYVWLAQMFMAFTPWSVNNEILNKITNGDVGVELCRPMDLYTHWYAKTAAPRISMLILRGIPVITVGLLLPSGYNLRAPDSFAGFILMLLSVCCAFLLCNSFAMLIVVVRMNIKMGDGPMWLMLVIGQIFSGVFIPLQLWPDYLQKILLYQPFAGYLDIPLRLYVGSMPPSEAAFVIFIQLSYTAVFTVLGRWLLYQRLKNVVVQGG
jgi:ABC-2 type transport system permease protein